MRQHRADTQAQLQQQRHRQRRAQGAQPALPGLADRGERKSAEQNKQQIGEQAVIELDGGDILEGRKPGRRARVEPGRHKARAHFGPGGIDKPGVGAGD